MATSRATLEDVAQRAQVSRQTVSNVLNAPDRVAAPTASRVLAAIDELGYRPHAGARALRTRRSHVLGLRLQRVGDGINGAVLDRFLHALTEHAQARDYRVLLFTADDDLDEVRQYQDLLDTADLDAFVLTGTHHGDDRTRWLAEHDVPFVTFGRPWSDNVTSPHPWVDVDGAHGTRLATQHLLDAGHRRIGLLGWPEGSDVGADRRRGWVEAMTAAGLGLTEASMDDDVAAASRAAATLVHQEQVTAIVAVSDSLALGALAAVRTMATPVAVVGFDDTPVAAALGLSSVAQPLVQAAEHAVDLLLHTLDGGSGPEPEPHVLLHPHLVVRASSTSPA